MTAVATRLVKVVVWDLDGTLWPGVALESDGLPAPYSGETVVVGAAEQYEARCRDCHEAGVGAALVAA